MRFPIGLLRNCKRFDSEQLQFENRIGCCPYIDTVDTDVIAGMRLRNGF